MLNNCIPHPAVHSFSTTRTTTFGHLSSLPQLQNTVFATMDQVHGSRFAVIDAPPKTQITDVDALVTTLPGITLAVKHADCLPILIYHPKGVVAAIHAGRRSTQQHILKKVLRYLKLHFALDDIIHLWFGPAICTSCHTFTPTRNEHFNLQRENRLQAESIFDPEKLLITYANRCTAHENDEFHSYRKTGPGTTMNWSVISLQT